MGWVWLLVWAPIGGHWHGIAHPLRLALSAPAVAATVSTTVSATGEAAAEQAVPMRGHADEGHAPGSALCQVLDHLGHASALSAWPVLPVLLSFLAAAPVSVARPDPLARVGWTPQARAPPSWI